jgi:hypothetical protein
MASHESYTSFPFGLHGILVDLSCTQWLKSIQIFLWSLVFSCIFLLMTLNINKNCFLLMMRYVCYLIQNTISMFRWNKVKLKKYIEDILQVTTFKNKYARPYGINSRVEHSGIIHDTIGKKWPNPHMSNSNDESWCLCILCCAHPYILTVLWPRNMIFDSHNIMFCMFQFAYIFLININNTLRKLKLGFIRIV